MRKLWCRLFHRKRWRLCKEYVQNGEEAIITNGQYCVYCGLWHNKTVITQPKEPGQWLYYMSRVEDPTSWDYPERHHD